MLLSIPGGAIVRGFVLNFRACGAAASPAGAIAVAGGAGPRVEAFKLETAERMWSCPVIEPVVRIAFSKRGNRVLLGEGGGRLQMLRAKDGSQLRHWSVWQLSGVQPKVGDVRRSNESLAAGFSATGRHAIAAATNGSVFRWSVTGRPKAVARHVFSANTAVAMAPGGAVVACGSKSGRVGLLEARSLRIVWRTGQLGPWIHGLAFSGDGKLLAVAAGLDHAHVFTRKQPNRKQRAARLWILRASNGHVLARTPLLRWPPLSAAFISRRRLAVTTLGGKVLLYHVPKMRHPRAASP